MALQISRSMAKCAGWSSAFVNVVVNLVAVVELDTEC